ncbi:MAG: hypothetical protein ACRYHQ_11115 [Janthinobacterium lividum]
MKGQTTGCVHIDIGNRVTVHASITNEAIDDLALKVGDGGDGLHQGVRCHRREVTRAAGLDPAHRQIGDDRCLSAGQGGLVDLNKARNFGRRNGASRTTSATYFATVCRKQAKRTRELKGGSDVANVYFCNRQKLTILALPGHF